MRREAVEREGRENGTEGMDEGVTGGLGKEERV